MENLRHSIIRIGLRIVQTTHIRFTRKCFVSHPASLHFSKVNKYVEAYKKTSSIPILSSAVLLPGNSEATQVVHSHWSVKDVIKMEKTGFSKDFILGKTLDVVASGVPQDQSTVSMFAFSRSGKKQAVVRQLTSPEEKTYIEVWNEFTKEKTFDMSERKEHGKIIVNAIFGSFEWSISDKYILYMAEAKQPKTTSFFKEVPDGETGAADLDAKKDSKPLQGAEYLYKEDWGEQVVDICHPVACILEVETGKITVLSQDDLDTDISSAQAIWGPNDTVVLVGYPEFPRRLGIVFCTNRRSALYWGSATQKLERLTEELAVHVRKPKFSPDFKTLIYLENPDCGPHFRGSALKKIDWGTKKCSMIVDVVDNPDGISFPGLYVETVAGRCWSEDGKYIFLSTIWRSHQVIVAVDVVSGKVQRLNNVQLQCTGDIKDSLDTCGASTVLDVHENVILISYSTVTAEPSLYAGAIHIGDEISVDWKNISGRNPSPLLQDFRWEVVSMIPTLKNQTYPDADIEMILIESTVDAQKRPLIVMGHGGPHAAYVPGFITRLAFFCEIGYNMCLVNFRGSVGFGENNVKSILGKVGTQDIADVKQSIDVVKSMRGDKVGDIFITGGSHGGFIAAHFIGQFPNVAKAAALLNPVINLMGELDSTDIPDWVWTEGGFGDQFNCGRIASADMLASMWKMSPLQYVEKVETPTLLLIGSKDLRVPPGQSLNYYKVLKARKVPVKLFVYEDNHSLSKVPHNSDLDLQIAVWFEQHSSKTVA